MASSSIEVEMQNANLPTNTPAYINEIIQKEYLLQDQLACKVAFSINMETGVFQPHQEVIPM